MKKLIISILCVAVFFIGLGGLVKQAGAKFKSDERALALVKQARIAIGGEAAINNVKSLTAKGKAVHVFNFDGTIESKTGDFEINLALPDKFAKMVKLRVEAKEGESAGQIVEDDKIIFLKKGGDRLVLNSEAPEDVSKNGVANADGKQIKKEFRIVKGEGEMRGDEFLRTMLGLFMSAPAATEVDYLYVGSETVDGNECEIVEAKTGDNPVAKIYLSKSTNLPVMMSYQGMEMPKAIRFHKPDMKPKDSGEKNLQVFVNKVEMPKLAEISVKFSDYRNISGLLLPFVWTQTANGNPAETVTIENYEINPANMGEKFNQMPKRVFVRTERKQ
jgi:hypothetical protein